MHATTNCRQHKEIPGIQFRERHNRFASNLPSARLTIGDLKLSWGSKGPQITSPI